MTQAIVALPPQRAELLGAPIDALTMPEAVAMAEQAIARRTPLLFGVVNAAKLVNMRRDPTLRRAVLAADVILADGMPVVWAAGLLRRPLPERVAGIDLMIRLLERADRRRYRVYCLGATETVLAQLRSVLAAKYPGAVLAGWQHGYFSAADEPAVAAAIRAAAPDILFVAMSSPKKEEFLARWARALHVPVCHGVGGAFDVLSGKVRRAPPAWQRLGLEWLHRVLLEPRRLWRRYLVTNTLFVGMVLAELATARRTAPARRLSFRAQRGI